jgi:hypothetical protein
MSIEGGEGMGSSWEIGERSIRPIIGMWKMVWASPRNVDTSTMRRCHVRDT